MYSDDTYKENMHFNFEEYPGTKFFWESLSVYKSTLTNIHIALLIGYLLITLYFIVKGTAKERNFFVIQPIILLILVLNPWVAWIYAYKLDLASRFFRFFWLLPVILIYMYFLATVVLKKMSQKKKVGVSIVLLILMIAGGYSLFDTTKILYKGTGTGTEIVDNIYKIEDDVLEAACIIEQDKGSKSAEVKVLYDYNTYIEIRTYDASIISAIPESGISIYNNVVVDKDTLDELVANEDWVSVENVFMYSAVPSMDDYLELDSAIMKKALHETDTKYVIAPINNIYHEFWLEMGTTIGETENYTIIRVEE